jgi:hypothetical protein
MGYSALEHPGCLTSEVMARFGTSQRATHDKEASETHARNVVTHGVRCTFQVTRSTPSLRVRNRWATRGERRRTECSKPKTAPCVTASLRSIRTRSSSVRASEASVQRLPASPRSTHDRHHDRQPHRRGVLNASRHHRNQHHLPSKSAFESGCCAQRLSASPRSTHRKSRR